MTSLPRRSPHCHPPFCHLEDPVEAPRKTVPQSPPAKKKIMEFLVTYGMQLMIVALFMVIPITLLLCLATDTVRSDNTWLGFVAYLYISATSILITLEAILLNGLLLLPLYLAFAYINFLLWLFNCN